MRMPLFSKSDWKTWFLQIEAQFRTGGIKHQETKFDHVVGVIDTEIAGEVIDIIRNPPEAEPYTQLKKAIIDRTMESDRRRFQQLLSQKELKDRKPSQFLRKLLQLGEKSAAFDKDLLRELFVQKMPHSIKPILAAKAPWRNWQTGSIRSSTHMSRGPGYSP